ncbi:MAG: hypothetical protein KBT14_03395, partial [Proteobacteria bacterium]|nr:hypothetical protein [Candidatus Enterousia onthequi]
KEKLKYRESKKLSKKHIFLRVFSKITISVCVFCAFFISPVFASLPSGYTELEYIESTGTQYIDTGTIPTVSDEFEAEVSIVTDTSNSCFFGASTNFSWGRTNSSIALANATTNDIYFRYGNNPTTIIGRTTVGTNKTKASLIGTTLTIGATTATITRESSWSTEIPTLTLFKRNMIGAEITPTLVVGRMFSFKWFSNSTLVHNMIPAKRNSDSAIGMYDTVSGTFFTNQGTGSFIAGPVAEIKIATTKMVDDEFAAAEAKLATTVQTIESVVSRTITQTGQITTLHETKQTRPDESCPANMKCLLVQDEDGTPHWYPIIEP